MGAIAWRCWDRYRKWRTRRKLGLPPLTTLPVEAVPPMDKNMFHRSNYVPLPVKDLPYARQAMDYARVDALLDLEDPSIPLDDAGVALWRHTDGQLHHHPVTVAQYGLAALGGFERTGDRRYLARAVVNAERLVSLADVAADRTMWFTYRFPHTYYDVTMQVPWWSGMAQGQALSLFARLARMFPEGEWPELSRRTFQSFSGWRALGQPWITTMDSQGYLWFEEYAGDVEPLLVINGHVFALYGLYDYAQLTGDEQSIALFDGGATTVLNYVDKFRVPGGVSYYCVREGYCQRPEWQNRSYHPIHVQQMRMLGKMTGDDRFEAAAVALASDFAP